MVTFAQPTETASGRLPAGEFVMTLDSIEEEASTYNPSESRLKFIFNVESVVVIDAYPDEAGESDDELEAYDQSLIGNKHWAWCSNKMGGNATLRKWLTGMLGRTIEKNDNLSPDQFLGKPYKVTLGMVPYTFNGESGEKFDIANIKPYRAPRQRGRQAPAPDPEGFDDEPVVGPDGKNLPF